MKTLKSLFFPLFVILFAQTSFAQNAKSDTLNVSGECGMCKKKIETAAKAAGATYAAWSPESKKLVVNYNPAVSNAVKIQQGVAAAGYDTEAVKASEGAYNNLHECCKYDRTAATAKAACCTGEGCTKNGDCCKGADCCKGEACCTAGATPACCKQEAANGKKVECCKDGKCSKHEAVKQGK